MFWKQRNHEVATPSPQALIEMAVQEISSSYGISGSYIDHFSKSRIVRTSINHGEIDLTLEFTPAFPAAAPIVRISSGTSAEFLPALEAMSDAGLMDADGTLHYSKCFYFGPEMRVSNLVFLCGIILRSCHLLTVNRVAQPAPAEALTIPQALSHEPARIGRGVQA
jgi:hypothetical protein